MKTFTFEITEAFTRNITVEAATLKKAVETFREGNFERIGEPEFDQVIEAGDKYTGEMFYINDKGQYSEVK